MTSVVDAPPHDTTASATSKTGSNASSKQIAWSVYKGQRVTCKSGADTITGYVFGQDDYHWLVASSNLVTHLVHKSCPLVSIDPESTFGDERNFDALEEMVGPFRRWVCENVLRRPDPMSASIQRVG